MSDARPPSRQRMDIPRHGSCEPLDTSDKQGIWPVCLGYLRGRDPSPDEIRATRDQMVEFCQDNQLFLARIFHDLDVEPTSVNYPSLHDLIDYLRAADTHTVLLADLELVREPSHVLAAISTSLTMNFPGVRTQCFVQTEVYERLARPGE